MNTATPSVSPFTAFIERWRPSAAFNQSLLLVVVAFTAVFAIAEIAARESVLSMLSGQISSLKSEFVEQNRNGSAAAATTATFAMPTSSAAADRVVPIRIDRATEERASMLFEIKSLERLKRSLQTLIALGSDSPIFSLRAIQRAFNMQVSASRSGTAQDTPDASFALESFMTLHLLSSDQLIAIAIMACGAIGAMIAALRGGEPMTLRALSLGLASGFVVYLAIKGGKHVFLLQSQGELVAFNPYGSAFAGLLAGLFTERAHQVLSTLVDDFVERLRAASGSKKEKI